ncbi:HNH endonuclease signature motif containing protein [Leptospira koniambonensis]|uniref:HNH endonuclease signature motif containing protein n=1 Tax=Leptospira koniambonensis TaxID=2484950 RepID=UPI003EBDA9DC
MAKDFNNKCGYTDCSDSWFGGKNSFHIDHFIPWKKNPGLKTKYSNLVYCCSYVNILKSDDEGAYIDPCDIDYNLHFERDSNGNIIPKNTSVEAKYMHSKLKLYLKRYQIIWKLEQLKLKMEKLIVAIRNSKDRTFKNKLRLLNSDLATELIKYMNYLESNQ